MIRCPYATFTHSIYRYIGAYIAVVDPENNPTEHLSGAGIAAMFFFYLWTAFYTPTWNGTPWVMNSEMFDQSTR